MPSTSASIHPSMAGQPWERELRAAIEAARAAGAIQMERLGNLEHIVHKSAKDVVTEADHLSEEVILAHRPASLPGRPVLAEESGH